MADNGLPGITWPGGSDKTQSHSCPDLCFVVKHETLLMYHPFLFQSHAVALYRHAMHMWCMHTSLVVPHVGGEPLGDLDIESDACAMGKKAAKRWA